MGIMGIMGAMGIMGYLYCVAHSTFYILHYNSVARSTFYIPQSTLEVSVAMATPWGSVAAVAAWVPISWLRWVR